MAISGYEYVTVDGDYVTVDLAIWRRYKRPAPGIVEATLDRNPHLARIHRTTPFLPVGTQVRIPIDLDLLAGAPRPRKTVTLTGRV